MLPAVYLFVGTSLNATPVQLGTLTLCRAMVQVSQPPHLRHQLQVVNTVGDQMLHPSYTP